MGLGCNSVVGCLPSMHKAQDLISSTARERGKEGRKEGWKKGRKRNIKSILGTVVYVLKYTTCTNIQV